MAFLPPEELYRLGSPWAALNLALVGAFGLDMLASFRLVSWAGGCRRAAGWGVSWRGGWRRRRAAAQVTLGVVYAMHA